ncbi:hypothetical protein, partial [Pseudomonas sp.]
MQHTVTPVGIVRSCF